MRILSGLLKIWLILLMVYAICFIWNNQDEIITLGYNIFKSEHVIDIKEANEYKRYYNYTKYTLEEDYIPNSKEDLENIIFNYLNNGWEEFTFYCPHEYENCINDVKSISNDPVLLSSINNYVSPFNSFSDLYTKVKSDNSITFETKKNYSPEMIDEINKEVDLIMPKLLLDGCDTKLKIKRIHNYIISHVEYDKSNDYKTNGSSNAYGLLKNKKAVCSGYADTMAIFLDRIGIPNLKVASNNHVWNLVYVDGKWLHLDATWDDPINAVTTDHRYDYFLITTQELLELDTDEHTYNEEFYHELKEA